MSFNVKTGNAEDIRKKLLAEKGIGIIQIDANTLRVAFSSIDEEKIDEVYIMGTPTLIEITNHYVGLNIAGENEITSYLQLLPHNNCKEN